MTPAKQQLDQTPTQHIRLSDITLVTDPSHPLYDEVVKKKPDAQFVDDMREKGQLQNIVLVRESGKLLVAAGRRRVMAAEQLGWETIEAKIYGPVDKDSDLVALMIRENNQRKDKTLIHKSRDLKTYTELLKKEYLEGQIVGEGEEPKELPDKDLNKSIESTFGISRFERNNLELLAFHCSPKVLKMAEQGKFSESVAVEVARLYPDNFERQERHIQRLLDKGKKVSQKTVKPLGDRPFKTNEILELADYTEVPKQFREVLYFLVGKSPNKDTTLEKFGWLRNFVDGGETEGSGDEVEGEDVDE